MNPMKSQIKKIRRSRWWLPALGLLTVFLLTPITVFAASTIDSAFPSGGYVLTNTNQRKIVRDSNGYWYVAYVRYNSGTTYYEVKLARCTDASPGPSSTWDKVTLFGSGGIVYNSATTMFIYPSIDVNSSRNQIHIILRDSTNAKLLYSKCTDLSNWNQSSGWTQAGGGISPRYDEVLASGSGTIIPAIAVDSNSCAHISYEKTSGLYTQIFYRMFNGTSWTTEKQLTSTNTNKTLSSIDIGYNGVVHVLYKDNVYFYYTKSSDYTTFDAPVAVIALSGPTFTGNSSLAALDSENKVFVIGYTEVNPSYTLKQNYYNGTSWAGGTGIPSGTNVETSSTYKLEYPLVGTKTDDTSHRVLGARYASPYDMYYYTWNGTVFANRTDTLYDETGTTYLYFVSLEKHAPSGSSAMGYAWYNNTDLKLYFDTIDVSLTLSDHSLGQVADKFISSSPVTDVLFQFKLTRQNTVTVDNLRVNYTTASGVVDADVTNGELWLDSNGDGVGETSIQTGVAGSGGKLTFTTNFTPDVNPGANYLVKATVSNLVGDDTTTFSVGTADIDVVESGVTKNGTISNAIHTMDKTLALANHSTQGQVTDKFTTTPFVTDVFYRFNLTRSGTVTVDTLSVNYTTGTVVDGDVTSGELWVDLNNNGVIDGEPTDTKIQDGVSGSGGKLTFTTDFSPSLTGTNYLVRATISNLVCDDTTTFSLPTGDITLLETPVTKSSTVSNVTHTEDGSITLANHGSGQVGDAFGDSTPVTAVLYRFKLTQTGSAQVTTVKVHFTTTGGVSDSDFSNTGELWEDTNGNGTYDGAGGGDTLLKGSVTPASGIFTFTPASPFTPGTGGTIYFIRATVINLVPGDNTEFSMTTTDITPTQTGATKSGSASNVTHTADGTLTLANHDLGQVTDKLDTIWQVTDVFFRFKLTRAGNFTVTQLIVNYTTGNGIGDSDIDTAELWEDVDNDGVVDDPGDTLLKTGTVGSGKLTFTKSFQPSETGTNYLVKVHVFNLRAGDTTTFSMGASDITTTYSAGVSKPGSISNVTHTADGILTLADHTVGQVGDKFSTTTPVTDVLFRFRLTRTAYFNVTTIRLKFTTSGGVAYTDVSDAELWIDSNNNGIIDESTTYRLVDNVTPTDGGGYGLITFNYTFEPSSSGIDYLVRVTAANISAGDTTTFSLTAAEIDTAETNVSEPGSITDATHTAEGSLTLANHTVGQIGDSFGAVSSYTGVIYRLKLTRVGIFNIENLRVNYTTAGGVLDADVVNGELWEDVDNDGVLDSPGDTKIQDGISGSGGVLTFTTDFTPSTSGSNYLIKATVNNIVAGDTTTLSLGTADIDAQLAPKSGSTTGVTHTAEGVLTLANHGSGQVTDKFNISTPVTDVLFRFKLTRTGALTITDLRVNYTTGTVVDGDVTSGELWEDVNSDGVVDGGDTSIQSGINGSGGKLTFTTDFSPSESGTNYLVRVTVANLVPDDTTTFSMGTADIDGNATSESGSISNVTHTLNHVVDLAGYGGQEADKFTDANSVTGAELFRFQLTNNNASSTVTVTQIEFPLSSVTGIQSTDFSSLQIYIDANGDGDIGGTETTAVGGDGSVDSGVTKFTFSTSFDIAAAATVQYILKGDVMNLSTADSVTIALGASNITLSSGTVGGTAPTNATHTADGSLLLSDFGLPGQTASQTNDNLGSAAQQTVVLFRFKLKSSDALVTVDTLKVNFTTTGGIANADVTAGELWLDDGDGGFDAFQDVKIQDSVTPSGGILTFTTDFVAQAGTGANYYVRATVSNLIYLDTTTLSMSASDITPLQTSVTPSGSVTSVTHTHDPGVLPQIIYSHDASNDIYYTTYEQNSWQAETKLADRSTAPYWKVARTTPNNSEQVAVWTESGGSPRLYFSLWDGVSWGIGDQWIEDASYTKDDYAKNKGVSYKCKLTHTTSTADDEPGVGKNWTSYWAVTTAVQDLGGIATNSYRCFDAAYEQTSNELLIVATQTGGSFIHHVQYWTWNGKTLSGPNDYLVGSPTYTLQWVKLAPKPGSNEIAAITSDTASDVYGFIWDGSAFGNKTRLENGSLTSYNTEAIAVAYENSDASLNSWLTATPYSVGNYVKNKYNDYVCKSPHTSSATDEPGVGASWTTYWTLVTQAVFAWGKTYIGNSIGYATWDNVSATYTTGSVTGLMGGPITWLRLATDPNSDDMILGMVANTSPPPNLETLRWNGSAWAASSVAINSVPTGYCGTTTVNRAFDLIFEYDSSHKGHAAIVYGGTGFLQYRHSTDGGATWGSELQFPTTYDRPGYWVQLERNLDNVIHLALHDADDSLNMLTWEVCTANAWATSTSYSVGNYVCNKAVRYSCIQNHTSGSASEPGVGASWTTYWVVQNVPSWALSTSYSVGDYVWHNSVRYKCKVAHTSDAAKEPGVGANWQTYWDLDWTHKREITTILEQGAGRNIEAFALVVIIPANPEFQTQPPPPNLNYNWGSQNARITLKGVNFGTSTGTVEFATSSGTQAAEILSWNPTEVVVRVPSNAISGYGVKLTNTWGKFATSTETFTVITGAPTFTALIPTYTSNFATVDVWKLTGTNLSPDCSVYLKKTGQTSIYASSIKLNLEDEWALSRAYSVGDYVWHSLVSYRCKLAHTSQAANEPGVGASWTTNWELPGTPPVKPLNERTFIDAATFILTGAATGTWDLVIKNPDNQEVTKTEAVTVTIPAEVSSGTAANYDSAGYPNARNIVRDSAGNWWAVFRGGAELYINKREAGSAAWGTPVKLVGVSGALLYNNPAGIGLAHGGVSVDIYRAGNWPGSTWPSITDDRLHIVWQAGYGSESKYLRYAKCSDLANYNLAASWSGIYLPWVTGRSYYVADVVTNGGNYYQCKVNHTSGVGGDEPGVGGSWGTYWSIRTKPVYDTLDATAAYYTYQIAAPDIVVDSEGYVHVSYYMNTSSDAIKYRTNRTRLGHWDSIRSVASNPETNPVLGGTYTDIGSGASIDIDSSNYVHFAWSQVRQSTDRYVIRHVKTTDWTTFPNNGERVEIIADNQDMAMPSLVVDRDNNIYVVARELDTQVTAPDDNDLWFAYYNGSGWTETNVTEDLRNHFGKDRFNEYYLDLDVESPVLGTRERTTDHVLMTKVIGGLHWGKVIYLKWDDTNKKWDYEKDPDAGTDSQYYVSLERRSPAYYMDIAYLFYDKDTDKLKSEGIYGLDGTPTAVKIASFKAMGNGNQVLVEWVTKTEIDNLGFNLYKSTQKTGIYTKLNSKMIPGSLNSVSGRRYTYDDADVVKGQLYYYKLEDIDLKGKKTMHGPVCVDWDGDGIPDDVDPTPGQPDPVQPSPNPGPAPTPGSTDPEDGSNGGNGGNHSVTKVDLIDLNAYQTQEGIVLKWHTGYELNNLGFHIYREENGESYRITPEIVMGSVWLTGRATPLNGGRSYTWWDTSGLNTQSSSLGAIRYWLEDIDLSGKRTLHGPVEVVQPANESQLIASKPSSNYAKKLDVKYEEFWKIQDLRERLRQASLEPGSSTELPSRTTRISTSPRALKTNHAASEVFTVTEPKKRQWSLAGKPAVKLLIKEEGWYRVTQPELVAAGLDPNCKPKYLQLFVDGEEQAMLVTGSGDGHFNTSDAIEFYATGLDTQFTDTRVYWLVDTSTLGKRVRTVNALGVPTPSTSYLHTVERKDRIYYLADLLNGEESNFFGLEVWNVSWPQTDQILTLPHLDTDVTPNAILEVTLQGYSLVPHLVNVLVNEHSVGEVTFDDWSKVTVSFPIPQNWLQEGDNLVTFVPPDDEVDVTLIVSVKLSYWHTFTADDDALKLTATGGEEVSITGFTGSNIRVVDITDPKKPCEAMGTVEAQGGGYSVTFNVPGTGVRTVLAFTDQKLKIPFKIVANHPTEWHNKQEGYNYVMMVHGDVAKDFKLHPLTQSRERQGFTVATVDVEDIYDEFSFGAKDTRALKDFLERAMNQWVKKPQYVLLVGDATFDPRDFLGMGQIDFVPTKIVEATFLETASDDWFVDFDDDGLPNIPIGRLPARTPEELSTIVSKIVTYDRSKQKMRGALLVAGKKLYGEEDYDFEAAVQDIANMLKGRMTVAEIFQDQVGDDAARETLLADVNQGPSMVNFVGHGSNEVWASLFCSDDAPALTNSSKLAFFINMTCLNGFFHDLYTESLAEALIRAEQGGAVAVWTSSGLTYPDQQHLINQELIRQLLSSEKITIGQAAASAKAATGDQDVRRTWILFGDPATRLKY